MHLMIMLFKFLKCLAGAAANRVRKNKSRFWRLLFLKRQGVVVLLNNDARIASCNSIGAAYHQAVHTAADCSRYR